MRSFAIVVDHLFFHFGLAAPKQQIKIWFSESLFSLLPLLLLLSFSSFAYENKVTKQRGTK